jgi:flagellar FliL protein
MAKAKKKDDEATPDAEAKEKPEGAEGEGAEGEGAPKKGKKKLVIIAGAVVLLLAIVGGLFAAGVIGGGDKKEGEHTEEAAEAGHGEAAEEGGHGGGHGEAKATVPNAPTYYELPQFLVNLNSTTGKVSFLKMSVTLELKDATAVPVMDANKPRIVDTFNTYLRELRPTDIQGSAGIYRLRTELLTRLNGTIEDGLVKDILFGEIIVQ